MVSGDVYGVSGGCLRGSTCLVWPHTPPPLITILIIIHGYGGNLTVSYSHPSSLWHIPTWWEYDWWEYAGRPGWSLWWWWWWWWWWHWCQESAIAVAVDLSWSWLSWQWWWLTWWTLDWVLWWRKIKMILVSASYIYYSPRQGWNWWLVVHHIVTAHEQAPIVEYF